TPAAPSSSAPPSAAARPTTARNVSRGHADGATPVLVEPSAVLAALGLPPDTPHSIEPAGETPGAPARFEAAGRVVIVRRPWDATAAMNHAAVSEALTNAGFAH